MRLGDVVEFQNGYAFKSNSFISNGDHKIVKIKEIKSGNVIFFPDSASINTNVDFEKYEIHYDDIVFALTGDPVSKPNPRSWVGRVARYNRKEPAYINQRVCIMRPKNNNIVNPLYVYYYFRQFSAFYKLASLAKGSASQANISTKDIENFNIVFPPIEKQTTIVSILNSIEQKISINALINKNLAQLAQAIYADIFITNADPAWPIGHLSDLITVRYGKDHKKLDNGPFPVYGSGGVMRYVERPIYEKESVLIPRKGTLNNVMYVNEPFWSVDTMFYTEMKLPDVAKFIYHFVKSKDLASLNAGSAVPSMTTDILNAMELYIPDAETLKRFESIVGPMYRAMQHNTEESKKLAAVRDSLLPRLMSGELDVSGLDL